MQIQRSNLLKALKRKGFKKLDISANHDRFAYYNYGQRTEVNTLISRGGEYRTLQSVVCAKIKRQMRFDTSKQLRDFAKCSMKAEAYCELLKGKGLVERCPK